jgi:hypothetical protein
MDERDPTKIEQREESERRIEAARQDAVRQQEAKEFLDSLKPGDETLKPIYNPEAYHFRSKYRGAAERGELQNTGCRHPIPNIKGYVDEDPARKRDGKLVNLFECSICHMPLWLVDPWGKAVSDNG